MRTIVVGVDGSESSVHALDYAASLVEELLDAMLIVVFARYVPALWAPHGVAENEFSDLLDEAEQHVRAVAHEHLDPRKIRWTFECRDGEPAQALAELAHETDADFVVIGRRGWSTVSELLLGSVSNRLVHRTDVRLLLVR